MRAPGPSGATVAVAPRGVHAPAVIVVRVATGLAAMALAGRVQVVKVVPALAAPGVARDTRIATAATNLAAKRPLRYLTSMSA